MPLSEDETTLVGGVGGGAFAALAVHTQDRKERAPGCAVLHSRRDGPSRAEGVWRAHLQQALHSLGRRALAARLRGGVGLAAARCASQIMLYECECRAHHTAVSTFLLGGVGGSAAGASALRNAGHHRTNCGWQQLAGALSRFGHRRGWLTTEKWGAGGSGMVSGCWHKGGWCKA